jgi:hypothetical protein
LVTLLMAAFLVAAGGWWLGHRTGDNGVTRAAQQQNEVQAYTSLQRIVEAQAAYRERSASLLGQRAYAAFLTHLWIAVSPVGEPVPLDLIPKALAVAVGPTKAHSGYYFVDVRARFTLPHKKLHAVDNRRQWAVAGLPRQFGRTGNLVFLADESGRIFALHGGRFSSQYPADPAAAGWVPLPTAAALKAHQAGIAYTLVAN